MKEEKENIEELGYMQQLYEQQYRLLTDSINEKMNALNELSIVQKALENSKLMQQREVLSGIGAGVFAKGSISANESFIVGVEGGFFVEMPVEQAKEYIAKEIEKSSAEVNSMMSDRKKIESSLVEITKKIESISGRNV